MPQIYSNHMSINGLRSQFTSTFSIFYNFFFFYMSAVGFETDGVVTLFLERQRIPMNLNDLPRILNLLTQHRCEDHLDVLHKTIVAIVIAIQSDLVRINDIVVIPDSNFLIGH